MEGGGADGYKNREVLLEGLIHLQLFNHITYKMANNIFL